MSDERMQAASASMRAWAERAWLLAAQVERELAKLRRRAEKDVAKLDAQLRRRRGRKVVL